MGNYLITISREFGCGGREIAIKLASKMGVSVYDKDLIDMTAKEAGLSVEDIKEPDEEVSQPSKILFREFGYGSSTAFYSEKAIKAQTEVIRRIADKGNTCIFFGRCSDYILKEYPNVLNFFIYAPLEKRIAHIAESYKLDYKDAEKMIKRVDRQRHNYYKYVTGYNRGDRIGKHVEIDVSTFGIDKTVQLMYEAVQIKFDKKQ